MKNKLAYFLFAAFIFGLVSCEGDQTVRYRFTGLDVVPANSAGGFITPTFDPIPAQTAGIRLLLFPEETYRQGRYFDPQESSVNNENPITVIKIWCNRPFNADTAGTLLNNYFVYVPGNYLYAKPLDNGLHPTARYNDDYEYNNFPDHADLLMRVAPQPGDYTFYVELQMDNGGIYTDSTSTMHLY